MAATAAPSCADAHELADLRCRTIVCCAWTSRPSPTSVISYVEARLEQVDGRERYLVNCYRTGGEAGWDEPRLLQAWWRYSAGRKARVVTWHGKGFDLPVLRLRAMIHDLSAAAWFQGASKWDSYAQRYAQDWHCDLMEQISDYGAYRNLGL